MKENNKVFDKFIIHSITQNAQWKKYCILGGFYQLLIIPAYISNEIPIVLISTLFGIFFFGFWLDTIRKNTCTSDCFQFGKINPWRNFKEGLLFNLLLIFYAAFFALILGLISLFPLVCMLTLKFLITSITLNTIIEYLIILYSIIAMIFATLIWILSILFFYPQIVEIYLNDYYKSKIQIKQIFKLTKNNLQICFKNLFITILLFFLSLIPFIGFYFEMIWANFYAKYIQNNKIEQ